MTNFIRYPAAREHLESRGLSTSLENLRRMVSQRRIPFHKPAGIKAVLFSAVELDAWLEQSRVEPRAAR